MKTMKDFFQQKNVLITGGSSGIGLALAKQLSELGAKVWILGRDKNKLEEAAKSIGLSSDRIFAVDVTKLDDLQSVSATFAQNHLPLHLLINSAGVTQPGEFESQGLDIFHWMMDVNYFGTLYAVKTFLPLMESGATIVNISSMVAILGIYGYSAYAASKYAVRGFSDSLRSELKLKGMNVSVVFPPDTQTPQLDYDNLYKPKITKELSSTAGIMTAEQVAAVIIKGISRKQYMIIPGMESKLIYSATNLFGKLTYPILDLMVASAIKKIKNQK
jgi:3-dehydrosphinganine reductase